MNRQEILNKINYFENELKNEDIEIWWQNYCNKWLDYFYWNLLMYDLKEVGNE